jgi:hypothetical protein
VLNRCDHIRQLALVAPSGGRTVSRVLMRRGEPPLATLDPMTGAVIRASKATAVRYERSRPGELVHMDVKKLARIPDGGGWRAHGRAATGTGTDAWASSAVNSTPSATRPTLRARTSGTRSASTSGRAASAGVEAVATNPALRS